MAAKKRCKVFVSYSRHDEALVKPLAGLLGVAADEAVFLDITSLKPGDPWQAEIENAVRACSVFVLCWCCQSSVSEFVKHEIDIALKDHNKRLVPVLFCPTALPSRLAERQWINLHGRVVHQCERHGIVAPPADVENNSGHLQRGFQGMSRTWAKWTLLGLLAILPFSLFLKRNPLANRQFVVCDFDVGPRAGERAAVKVQTDHLSKVCSDGKGSTGVILDKEFTAAALPEPRPSANTIAVAAISFITLICLGLIALYRRNKQSLAVADRAAAYFRRLG